MSQLFGIEMSSILLGCVIAFAVVLAIVFAFAVRSRVFLKLALRSARRRLARTTLIVVGLMLATTIIAAAFSTGDTRIGLAGCDVLDAYHLDDGGRDTVDVGGGVGGFFDPGVEVF